MFQSEFRAAASPLPAAAWLRGRASSRRPTNQVFFFFTWYFKFTAEKLVLEIQGQAFCSFAIHLTLLNYIPSCCFGAKIKP